MTWLIHPACNFLACLKVHLRKFLQLASDNPDSVLTYVLVPTQYNHSDIRKMAQLTFHVIGYLVWLSVFVINNPRLNLVHLVQVSPIQNPTSGPTKSAIT